MTIMGQLNLKISEDVDQKFRSAVARRIGMKKGNLSIAVEEALSKWADES